MDDCIFCKIITGTLPSHKIWEDDQFFAFLDINPIKEGHTLIVPKMHMDHLFSIDDGAYSDFFKATKKLAKVLKSALEAERIGLAVEGFAVPHVHIHLVPLNNPGELNPEKAKKASSEDLSKTAIKIRRHIH